MVARFASVLGKQARGTVLLEAPQQTKYLTPLEADQHTGVSNTQTTRLNPQQHLKTAELLLAHRQHRHHGAPPGTPEPAGVSPLSCRGVSSLYCAYSALPGKPMKRNIDQGRLAISTELSAANTHSTASARPRGSVGISAALFSPRYNRIAPLSKTVMSPSVSHGTCPNGC